MKYTETTVGLICTVFMSLGLGYALGVAGTTRRALAPGQLEAALAHCAPNAGLKSLSLTGVTCNNGAVFAHEDSK